MYSCNQKLVTYIIYIYIIFVVLSFEMTRPGSLHHLVWYGIQLLECENKGSNVRLTKSTVFPIGFGCKSFKELPLATNSFATANIDSLCQIDLNTFLYATGKRIHII